jgi:hypothetical protein
MYPFSLFSLPTSFHFFILDIDYNILCYFYLVINVWTTEPNKRTRRRNNLPTIAMVYYIIYDYDM